jgi:hypothetical protein
MSRVKIMRHAKIRKGYRRTPTITVRFINLHAVDRGTAKALDEYIVREPIQEEGLEAHRLLTSP